MKKSILYMCMIYVHLLLAQNDYLSSDSLRTKLYVSGGLSMNIYQYQKHFGISEKSPLSGFIQLGSIHALHSGYWYTALEYQPYILKHHTTEFYDYSNWSSINIQASYVFHKINLTMGAVYTFLSRWAIGGGIGISYTAESKFTMEGFGCSYPYPSAEYNKIRQYYYYAFFDDNQGVILNKVITPYLQISAWYTLNKHWNIICLAKYEWIRVPADTQDWYLFRMCPISIGLMYKI